LDDVYWAKEGRSSVDAAIVCVLLLGLVLLGTRPFDLSDDSLAAVFLSILTVLLTLVSVAASFVKVRFWHGTLGFFIFPLAIYGACRLGKPDSPWARRFYGDRNPEKQERSARRFPPDRRTERFKDWVRDAVGGTPEDEYQAKLARRGSDEDPAKTP
jgi:hypothetical protein